MPSNSRVAIIAAVITSTTKTSCAKYKLNSRIRVTTIGAAGVTSIFLSTFPAHLYVSPIRRHYWPHAWPDRIQEQTHHSASAA